MRLILETQRYIIQAWVIIPCETSHWCGLLGLFDQSITVALNESQPITGQLWMGLKWLVQFGRLLHSLSLVAIELAVGYETRPLIGWHHPFVTGWSKYRLGFPQSQSIVGSRNQWEFPFFFRGYWQPPYTALMAGKCLQLGLCKGTVKESRKGSVINDNMVLY